VAKSKRKHKTIPAKSNGKHPGGRPKIVIDMEIVKQLAVIQCTYDEMAAVLGITLETFKQRMKEPEFSSVVEKSRESGKASLRRTQYRLAMDGNPTMNIWLGKQWLGQADRVETKGELAVREMPQLNVIIEAGPAVTP